MRSIVLIGVLGGVLAGCTSDAGQEASSVVSKSAAATAPRVAAQAPRVAKLPRALSEIAGMPDRGTLLAYGKTAPVTRGASTWREVSLSEAHAVDAIAKGGMVVQAPDGTPIRLQYARHVEHGDGNWTWVGRPAGAKPGTEAILTFGEKAVFGTLPDTNGRALEVTTVGGRTFMVDSDPKAIAAASVGNDADMLASPTAIAGDPVLPKLSAAPRTAALKKEGAPAAQLATVDLAIGYTAGFATRLGGQSQANTRLNFIVDVANTAYFNSDVGGQLRIVRTMQVDYPDATLNRTALMELSGTQCTAVAGQGAMSLPDSSVNCTRVARPAALQSLINAKAAYGADLAVLVRTFQVPENQSCGIAWLIGGGQRAITPANAEFGLAVVSDSSGTTFPDNGATCRHETLAHELGHTMGLPHDSVTAAGGDDTNTDGNPLDPEEYGRYADSFGYKSDVGNFFTIMAVPTAGQSGFRVFSNPRISTCNNLPCGVAGQSDNARTLGQTYPVVASFSAPRVPVSGVWRRGDYNGDGRSDVLWHNAQTDGNSIWRSANLATPQAVATVASKSWVIQGAGDFNGDNVSDILWRNISTGANSYWRSANVAQVQALTPITDQAWQVVGVGDFSGDGLDDILWRNMLTGANSIWRSGNSGTPQTVTRIADIAWIVAAVGDFDNDGRSDIVWRNTRTGANSIWPAGNSAQVRVLTPVADQSWIIVGAGDFDGDNRDDLLWRNSRTGQNSIWKAGNSATVQATAAVTAQVWMIVGIGDYDGDGRDDIQWRNGATGQNSIWKSGNINTIQAMTSVPQQFWIVSG